MGIPSTTNSGLSGSATASISSSATVGALCFISQAFDGDGQPGPGTPPGWTPLVTGGNGAGVFFQGSASGTIAANSTLPTSSGLWICSIGLFQPTGSFSVVQRKTLATGNLNISGSTPPYSAAFDSPTTAGNMIMVFINGPAVYHPGEPPSGNPVPMPVGTVTASDSCVNSYAQIINNNQVQNVGTPPIYSQSVQQIILFATGIAGGADTVTVNWGGGGITGDASIEIYEIEGLTAGSAFSAVAWAHGLDFGVDPTRTNVVTGQPYAYPPTLTFPNAAPNAGVVSILEDPPVYFQVWDGGVSYPVGAIVVSSSVYYQALINNQGENPATSPSTWQPYAGTFSDGLENVRAYCHVYGIFASLYMDSQRPGSEWLDSLCQVANCVAVWTGSVLRFYPLCEVSALGGGYVYTAPTASGPIATVNDKWYVIKGAEAPVKVVQQNMQSVYNQVDVNYADQNSNSTNVGAGVAGYNQNNITICDQQHAFRYGTMIGSPLGLDEFIVDPTTATAVGWPIMKRQRYMDPFHFTFSLPVNFSLLDPMDLITLQEPGLFGGSTVPAAEPYQMGGSGSQDVRIFSMSESSDLVWSIEAERFIYGMHAPSAPAGNIAVYQPVVTANPLAGGGSVNTPYIFEPTAALAGNTNSIWIAVCGSDPNYGGCQIQISTDGGNSYTYFGSVTGNPNMGFLTSEYPSNTSPDNTDNLTVDLTESDGELQSWTSAQQQQIIPIALLNGGGTVTGAGGYTLTVPYEIVAYQVATLTSPFNYTLSPPILRGQVGTPIADHPITGSPAPNPVFVDLSPESQTHIFKGIIPSSSAVTGSVLYFKFPTFNTALGALQDISECVAYEFVVTSQASPNSNGSSYTVAPSPCLYQGQTGGWSTATTGDSNSGTWTDPTKIYFPAIVANFTTLAVNYSADDSGSAAFTNPAGGQTVFVTIYDPNLLGGTQPIQVASTNANATTPGYVYLGMITSNAYNTGTGTGGGGTGSGTGSSGTGGPAGNQGATTSLSRTQVTFTTSSLAPGGIATGFLNVAKSYAIFEVSANHPCRVEIYGNSTAQSADAGRAFNVEPTVSGVIADVTLDTDSLSGSPPGDLNKICMPPIIGMNSDAALSSTLYWRVTNNDSVTEPITVQLTVLPMEL